MHFELFLCGCSVTRILNFQPNTNIFVLSKFVEYEYRIYSFLANRSNTNIEYIRYLLIGRIRISNIFVTRKLSIRIRISNIRCQIFEYSNIFVLHCRRLTGNDVSGHYFHHYFLFFPVFFFFFSRFFFSPPSSPFLIEGVLGSKNLFSESDSKCPIT